MSREQNGSRQAFLTTAEVAAYCAVSSDTVLKWIKTGDLRGFHTPGGHYRIWKDDFRAFAARYEIPVEGSLPVLEPRVVLLVEEDPRVRNELSGFLDELDQRLRVEEAEDGFGAGVKIGRHSPDLVILDTLVEQRRGADLCRAIRANAVTREIRVLAITDEGEPGAREMREAGADECLRKPVTFEEFVEVAKRLLHVGAAGFEGEAR